MKKHTLIVILCLWAASISAQSCLSNGLNLFSQTSVDNFSINYPGCKHIEGYVYMLGMVADPITNLDGLSQIESMGAELIISGCDNLLNLDGLSNLHTIEGYFRLQGNVQLTQIGGLSNLSAVRGDFFYLSDNTELLNLEGLSNLDTIAGIFHLYENPRLKTLHGMEQLKYAGERFNIFRMDSLEQVDGLESLNRVDGDFAIEDCARLTQISGLNHAINIQGGLVLTGNPLLDDCAVQAVCDYLENPPSFSAFSNNGTNCSSKSAVEMACLTSFTTDLIETTTVLFPNPTHGLVQWTDAGTPVQVLQVLDVQGKTYAVPAPTPQSLDLSALPVGVYWIEAMQAEKRQRFTVVKW